MSTSHFCALRLPCYRVPFIRAIYFSSQPEQASKKNIGKIINVAIIGSPNAGKSTLINKVVGRKICAASNKVHTTTRLARAMCFTNETQIIFLDTPGIVSNREQKKYKLPDSMLAACHKSLRCADVVGVVHDVSNRWTKDSLHPDVVSMLLMTEAIPSFLMLNKSSQSANKMAIIIAKKALILVQLRELLAYMRERFLYPVVDQLKSKRQLLSVIRNLTNGLIAGNPIPGAEKESKRKQERGYSHFSDVFLISALNGDGVNEVKDYLINNAKPKSFHYEPTEFTDQSIETLIVEAVRAKFLDFLAQEIPYTLQVLLEYYEEVEEEEKIMCSVIVECPSERLMRLISGAGGGRLQQIKSSVRNDLIELFKKQVEIDLKLKVKNKPMSEMI